MIRLLRVLCLLAALLLLAPASAAAAPEAARPFKVSYVGQQRIGHPNSLRLTKVIVTGLEPGVRVKVRCFYCDGGGDHVPYVTAKRSRVVIRTPKTIVHRKSRLTVDVHGTVFSRFRGFHVRPRTGTLSLYVERCDHIASWARVSCSQRQEADAWATLTTCRGSTYGVQAQIPALGRRYINAFVKYTLQFQTRQGGPWFTAPGAGTDWLPVDPAGFATRRYLHTAEIGAPPGSAVRGVVDVEWRGSRDVSHEDARPDGVVAWLRRTTTAGRPVAPEQSDPPGLSAATCLAP